MFQIGEVWSKSGRVRPKFTELWPKLGRNRPCVVDVCRILANCGPTLGQHWSQLGLTLSSIASCRQLVRPATTDILPQKAPGVAVRLQSALRQKSIASKSCRSRADLVPSSRQTLSNYSRTRAKLAQRLARFLVNQRSRTRAVEVLELHAGCCPSRAKFAEVARSWPNLGRVSPKLGRKQPTSEEVGPSVAKVRPNSQTIGSKLPEVGQSWRECGARDRQIRPEFARTRPNWPGIGILRPDVSQIWPES